ncbi:MAG: universal stress protein [Candidatus Methanoperedens nitroreducens]|uniref:Universal stress protein n=1 Tax=Candidatus Methanoperedens nitratireducens TaxID=1392998 RepID=A0A0P8DZ12_9EURY|nr:universal stress protein [Candidatus Methanoperedens sp. BLZ2]KAB2948018.1 MAG: universal stress protein [Candidatus Methanoperedens sp.]KPQ43080.1 MAG: universal stress protein [Candidatus Methanoperedens sp. BLZ1]MBZ0176360.1 universal stress protein [Candidatus Methanoperedens nitroreducens]CAG0989924.1 Universal stress protein/MSMEI_3859 [Methanosarcinales archaeon]MCX9080201.1 universal stress protein [Candidatus Methanoperedens sp.]
MFEKVLFPTDFSEYSQKTLECIGEIPGIKELMLLHVVDATHPSKRGWTHGPHIENTKILMGEKKEYLNSLGLKVQTKVDVITEGEVYRAILETAEKEKVSLIVMGARGKSQIKDLLLGSVSTKVVHHAKTNLLIMRYKLVKDLEGVKHEKFCPMIFSKVLLPTDFSEFAGETISFIKNIKEIKDIDLLNVVSKGETEEEIEENVNEAKKRLGDIRDELGRAGFMVKDHVRVGNVPEEIISTAEDENVSLIAMSPHGKGWLRELLVGSTTCAVVRRANRPVLVVRAK